VQAIDANGNISQSVPTLDSGPSQFVGIATDTTPPSAQIVSPAGGTTLSGTAAIHVSAGDNRVVSGVELIADGNLVAAASPTGPAGNYTATATFTLAWDTTGVADGNHTLVARAYDGLGNNVGTSASITIAVANSANPIPDTTPPTTPTNLVATAPTNTSVILNWTASTDNVGVSGYHIVRNGTVIATTASVTTFTDSTVNASTRYSYQVQAFDVAGNLSALSNTASITTGAPPPSTDTTPPTTPANLVVSALSATQVNLYWTASTDNVGVTGYHIVRDGIVIATTASVTTASDSTVQAGTSHSYQVQAFDAAGNLSALSNAVSITTPALTAAHHHRKPYQ
jgi:chitodextrinase